VALIFLSGVIGATFCPEDKKIWRALCAQRGKGVFCERSITIPLVVAGLLWLFAQSNPEFWKNKSGLEITTSAALP
jgi:hypothetical protein